MHIETQRLQLRAMESKDADFLFQLNQMPEVNLYTGDKPYRNVQEAQTFIESYKDTFETGLGRWIIEDKVTKEPMGWCGLKYHEQEEFLDLGYRILTPYWNNGIATECSKACIKYAQELLPNTNVIARVNPYNFASIKVLEKVNMQYLATILDHETPVLLYGYNTVLSEEYD